jgi:hypothetical protein
LLTADPKLQQVAHDGVLKVMTFLQSKKGFWKYIS